MSIYKKAILFLIISSITLTILYKTDPHNSKVPLVAIANYGSHSTLLETVEGIKTKLTEIGYVENETVRYEVSDVNFDSTLIAQMLNKLRSSRPKVLVAISTPVAQAAKNTIRTVPIVYADVTDPVDAGLIGESSSNITGASDKQNLSLMLGFAKELIPSAQKVGILYSTGEANDESLVKMLKEEAQKYNIEVVEVPLEHARDAAARMNIFKNNVDFIYTGSSASVQSAFPAIVGAANSMNIPIINFDGDEVVKNNALASYGVSHKKVGANAAIIIDELLKGTDIKNIESVYPSKEDHVGYVNRALMNKFNLIMPDNLSDVIVVD